MNRKIRVEIWEKWQKSIWESKYEILYEAGKKLLEFEGKKTRDQSTGGQQQADEFASEYFEDIKLSTNREVKKD